MYVYLYIKKELFQKIPKQQVFFVLERNKLQDAKILQKIKKSKKICFLFTTYRDKTARTIGGCNGGG